jgi:hypothetical protein
MKYINLAIAVVVGLVAEPAHADIFRYSYTFGDGRIVSGEVTGIEAGNLVTDISNVSVNYYFSEFNGSGSLYSFGFFEGGTKVVADLATLSFDGLANNFVFSDSSTFPGNYSYTNFYYSAPLEIGGGTRAFMGSSLVSTDGYADPRFDRYDASRWTLIQVSTVPEPETLALMLAGLGLMGSIAFRRKAKQA